MSGGKDEDEVCLRAIIDTHSDHHHHKKLDYTQDGSSGTQPELSVGHDRAEDQAVGLGCVLGEAADQQDYTEGELTQADDHCLLYIAECVSPLIN